MVEEAYAKARLMRRLIAGPLSLVEVAVLMQMPEQRVEELVARLRAVPVVRR